MKSVWKSDSERISTARLVVTEPKEGSRKTLPAERREYDECNGLQSKEGNDVEGGRKFVSQGNNSTTSGTYELAIKWLGVWGLKYRFASSGRALVGDFRISDVEVAGKRALSPKGSSACQGVHEAD
ncbi:hypothetical protein B0H16DRAFT_1474787 [Mycena metata]|uniref:Uncharacterized protein n=1 Tax=Mycena metata TaxID=1033252 RepID=A0AAD7MJU3_9AGAR|nr:hypothetical protein B0H16DRAFT_1474787 [Mycena metata]